MPVREYWISAGQEALLEVAKRVYDIDFANLPPDPFNLFAEVTQADGFSRKIEPAVTIAFSLALSDQPPSIDLTASISVLTLIPTKRRLIFAGLGALPESIGWHYTAGSWYFKNNDGRISVDTPP